MGDVTGSTPAPFVLDCSVLRELARGESETIQIVQRYDAKGQPMVVPARPRDYHAILDAQTEDTVDAMHGLVKMERVEVAPVRNARQATRLATVMTLTGLEVWDAHVASVADASSAGS